MKKNKLFFILKIFGVFSVLCGYIFCGYAYAGKTGWMIFRRGQSPKPRAIVSVAGVRGDLSGILYNPAVLATVDRQEVFVYGETGIGEDSLSGLLYGLPFKPGAGGQRSALCVGWLNYDAGKENLSYIEQGREISKPVSLQTDNLYSLSYAWNFSRKLPILGITLKYATSRVVESVQASALAADLGLLWFLRNDLMFSLAGQNIGASGKFSTQGESLPVSACCGLSYSLKLGEDMAINIAGEVPYLVSENRTVPTLGLDMNYKGLSFFFGYRLFTEDSAFSGGFSVYFPNIDFSYGYLPARWLKPTHRFGLGFRMGETVQ